MIAVLQTLLPRLKSLNINYCVSKTSFPDLIVHVDFFRSLDTVSVSFKDWNEHAEIKQLLEIIAPLLSFVHDDDFSLDPVCLSHSSSLRTVVIDDPDHLAIIQNRPKIERLYLKLGDFNKEESSLVTRLVALL